MKKRNTFIINPSAGFGKTGKNLKTILKEISELDSTAKILLTRHPMHAIGLTKIALSEGAERLVVVGGDGTLNEVVNGYFDKNGRPHNEHASIAIVPSGTGSDFSRSIHQTRDQKKLLDMAINGDAKLTDVGLVEARDANDLPVKRYFINVSSMGLSGLVAGFMKTTTRKLGPTAAYFLSTVQSIRTFKAPTFVISQGEETFSIDNCSLVSVANGRFFGSGMHVAPNAQLDDGLFDLITIKDLSTMFFLVNGYRIYQGSHLSLDNVRAHYGAEWQIDTLSKDAVYIETDGELFAQLPAKFSIRPRALWVVR